MCDMLQLADVFESFRTKCIADYNLDPAHYFSSPPFTYDAFLQYLGVKLDLLTDINQRGHTRWVVDGCQEICESESLCHSRV